ncbi:hypothetical protein C2E23DRAFT_884895 [Lenzites betulinus]|nr:hypothetical protein C2E23DRAFT_884895 [Lenzites betulinus]
MSTNSDIQPPETTTDLYGALGRDLMDCDPPSSDFSEALLDFEEQLYDRLCDLPAAADRALAENLNDTSADMPDYYAPFFQEDEPCGHDGQGSSQALQDAPSLASSSGTTSSITGSARREAHGGGRSASRVRQSRARGESSCALSDVTTSSEDNDSSDDEYVPVKKTVKRGIAVNAGQAPKRPVLVDDTNTPRPSSAQVIYVPGSDSDE